MKNSGPVRSLLCHRFQMPAISKSPSILLASVAPFLSIAAAAAALWFLGVWLSGELVLRGQREMLAKELAHSKRQEASGAAPEFVTLEALDLPPEVSELRAKATAEPKNEQAQLTLAQHLVAIGVERRDPSFLMHGLGEYQATLRINPKNIEALRGLGDLCAEQGLFPEAAKSYANLLELKPDDIKVRTDYALVLIQSGQTKPGIDNLNIVLKERPENFPARLALALGYRVAGDFAKARSETETALKNAPDDTAKAVAKSFLGQIELAEKAGPEAVDQPTPAEQVASSALPPGTSPAAAVDSFFRNHPIIGPKLDAIIWSGPAEAKIKLKDFPVDAMPEVARQRFLARAEQTLSVLPDKISFNLVDADSDRLLLQFSAGGASAPEKKN